MSADQEAFIKSIDDIKSAVLQPAQTSQYYVEIPVPPLLSNQMRPFLFNDKDKINLLCCETSLPGVSLATSLNDNDRTGVTEEFAYRKNFDRRIDFTFYVDADKYTPIKYFEAWMKYIAGEDLSEGSLSNNNYHYRFRYPSEYTCQQGLTITKFERDIYREKPKGYYRGGGGYMEYKFVRVFPVSINSMPITYEASQLLKVTVTMSYLRYYITEVDAAKRGGIKDDFALGFGDSPFKQAVFNDRPNQTKPTSEPIPMYGGGAQFGTPPTLR
tara:strand:- start:44 stop:856 length:813 start_codon:yes stop_codon:yes gene_type:complete